MQGFEANLPDNLVVLHADRVTQPPPTARERPGGRPAAVTSFKASPTAWVAMLLTGLRRATKTNSAVPASLPAPAASCKADGFTAIEQSLPLLSQSLRDDSEAESTM